MDSDNRNPAPPVTIRPQLLNGLLRGFTLISRLTLLFSLARLLSPAEVGLYGLFMVSVTYAMFAVGLGFYAYSQREVLTRPRTERAGILLHHAGVTGLAYLVVLPFSGLAFAAGYMPWWMAPWFAGLLMTEHIAQEINRLLIATQRQLAAGVILFIRQGAWIWGAMMILWQVPELRGLPLVFTWWLTGGLLAIALGIWRLRREIDRPTALRWDWAWIGRGVRTGLIFLAATLSLRGILTFDRYLFEGFAGLDLLGVYTLYAGLAMALMNFIDATVFVFRYPPMVQTYQRAHYHAYRREWRRILRHTIMAVTALALPAALIAPFFGTLVGKPIYLENIALFWWLLAAICLQALGMIPHYGLYAMRRDRPILLAHASGLAAFFIFAYTLSAPWPRLGVPMALTAAFGWILFVKLGTYRLACSRGPLADSSLREKSL